jgi:hypothetical protein
VRTVAVLNGVLVGVRGNVDFSGVLAVGVDVRPAEYADFSTLPSFEGVLARARGFGNMPTRGTIVEDF